MSNLNMPSSAALARIEKRAEPWRNQDWQRLWLSAQAQTRPWQSLALVPAGPGAPPDLMLRIAVNLAHTGMTHLGAPIHVADATRITLGQLIPFSEEIARYTHGSEMILIALPALKDNVTAASLAQAADGVLLCVLLDHMTVASGKDTIEQIGANRFVGSAVFRTPKP